MKKICVIGIGMGNEKLLTQLAKEKIETSEILLTTGRIGRLFQNAVIHTLEEIEQILKQGKYESIAILVSGDIGFHSFSESILRNFEDSYDIELINGISSMQYFAAKLNKAYDDWEVVSMHGTGDGGSNSIIGKAAYNRNIFVLTDDYNNPSHICEILCRYGLGDIIVYAGENLSCPNERIVAGTAEKLRNKRFDSLSVMLIENENFVSMNRYEPVPDGEFIRGSVPMTKEEIRAIVLSKLRLNSDDIVYDIGAGTGAMSVEMAKLCKNGLVFAIEREREALDLINQNRLRHKAYNIEVIDGEAPEALYGLRTPGKAFIGGSGGRLKEIIKTLLEKNKDIKIIMTAVSLQTLKLVLSLELPDMEVICVNISKSRRIGGSDLMMAGNPVYVICIGKQG